MPLAEDAAAGKADQELVPSLSSVATFIGTSTFESYAGKNLAEVTS